VSECIGFDARKPWGLAGVVSGRNDSAGVEGDDDSSSRWWDKGPRVKEAVFGSKSSQNVSEHVGVDARTCGSLVRGKIELETRENASIHINFEVGRSWGHTYTALQCVAPKADGADWERCRNASESVRFEARGFPARNRSVSQGFASRGGGECLIWL